MAVFTGIATTINEATWERTTTHPAKVFSFIFPQWHLERGHERWRRHSTGLVSVAH